MNWFLNMIVCIAAFAAMEGVAWFTHRFIMHGILWKLHKDHHQKKEDGFFERNDFFFLLFATPGIILLFSGLEAGLQQPWFWAGLGITFYGLAYFLVHDVFIHQRFRWLRNSNSVYLRGIRRAHKIHHKKTERQNGECFGMLFVPFKYFKEVMRFTGIKDRNKTMSSE